ncbi:MAG: hypothetical protein KID09_19920 [Paenibacillus macerans]|nr:hypothetical protein [Paenibacillus macerans]
MEADSRRERYPELPAGDFRLSASSKSWVFRTEANASEVRFFKTLELKEARDESSGA